MSVRMHISRGQTRSRRSHHRAAGPRLSKDAKAGTARIRHFADPNTSMYRGKLVGKAAKKKAVTKTAKKKKASKAKKGE